MTPLLVTPLAVAVAESGLIFMIPVVPLHSARVLVVTTEDSGVG